MNVSAEAPDVRADIVLVAGVLVLFGGRLAFGGDDSALDASLFGGAVRALVVAVPFLTLAVDPTTGWDGNAWYVALVFGLMLVAIVWALQGSN